MQWYSGVVKHSWHLRGSVTFLLIEVKRWKPKICSECRACGFCALVQHEHIYYLMLLEVVNNFWNSNYKLIPVIYTCENIPGIREIELRLFLTIIIVVHVLQVSKTVTTYWIWSNSWIKLQWTYFLIFNKKE